VSDHKPSPLNEHQRHHVWATCQYVDRLIGDIEAVLRASTSDSPFAKYVDDLSAAEKQALVDQCAALRAYMVRVLDHHGANPGNAPSSARHAIRTALGLADVAAEEVRPQYMRGYGAMSDEALPRASSSAGLARVTGAAIDREAVDAQLRHAASLFEDVRKVCEAQRDPPQLVLTEALDMAAERAGTALDHPHSMPGGVNAAVRTAIMQTAADNADDVRRPLGLLIERVRTALAAATKAAGLADDAAATDEWTRLMRGMPPFEFEAIEVDPRIGLRKLLGKGVAHARLRRAIADQVGDRVAGALAAHGQALHQWSLSVWTRVHDDFQTRANAIRATLT
jgi:hypothetical protein